VRSGLEANSLKKSNLAEFLKGASYASKYRPVKHFFLGGCDRNPAVVGILLPFEPTSRKTPFTLMNPAFPEINKIPYEGPKSKNPLAFKHYNGSEIVEGKTMADHLRFSVVYWHTFRNVLSDPFGPGTAIRPWDDGSNSIENACNRVRVAFEFIEKLGAPYYAFHDRDVAPEGASLAESNKNLDAVVKVLKEEQERTGIKLLWGTASLFTNPRFCHGAATSPNADVFAYAAGQVKKALEVTHELGGAGYTFWGGREGYSTLWNTDIKREVDHLAKFLHMAVDYKKEIGFKGPFYIEPKPKEPTKHQYDSDSAACLNFLREYGLLEHFKLNLETNHATLAGHTMHHECEVAAAAGALGSVDANTGDELIGWDTDQFPTSLYLTTQVMLQGAPRKLRAHRSLLCPHRRDGRLRPRTEDRGGHSRRRPPGQNAQGSLFVLG
jgi:xylose isomerase